MQCFLKIFDELSMIGSLILWQNFLYVEQRLTNKIFKAIHKGNLVIIKPKQLLRSKISYSCINKDIENLIWNFFFCQVAIFKNSQEPLTVTVLPKDPWENIAIDLHGPLPFQESIFLLLKTNIQD